MELLITLRKDVDTTEQAQALVSQVKTIISEHPSITMTARTSEKVETN